MDSGQLKKSSQGISDIDDMILLVMWLHDQDIAAGPTPSSLMVHHIDHPWALPAGIREVTKAPQKPHLPNRSTKDAG